MRIPRSPSPGDGCVSALVFAAVFLAPIMFFPRVFFAQDATGALEGHVSDKTGAVMGDPNTGRHTVEHWINSAAFQRLDPVTQAVQFGNSGRNVARGPSYAAFDFSALKAFRVTERVGLQFRGEFFNLFNHTNLGLPVADIASSNFGRILLAGPARLTQFAFKATF